MVIIGRQGIETYRLFLQDDDTYVIDLPDPGSRITGRRQYVKRFRTGLLGNQILRLDKLPNFNLLVYKTSSVRSPNSLVLLFRRF